MTTVLTIIATLAGTFLFICLLFFLLIGLMTWWEKHDFDPIADAISWMCYFWEKRL